MPKLNIDTNKPEVLIIQLSISRNEYPYLFEALSKIKNKHQRARVLKIIGENKFSFLSTNITSEHCTAQQTISNAVVANNQIPLVQSDKNSPKLEKLSLINSDPTNRLHHLNLVISGALDNLAPINAIHGDPLTK
jgi:hypothetical protein